MIFAYKARDASGAMRNGSLEGESLGEVADILAGRGLQVLEVSPLSSRASGRLPPPPPAVAPAPAVPAARIPTPSRPVSQARRWPRLLGGFVGLSVVLLALSQVPSLFHRARVVEVVLTGAVKASAPGDTGVYVYFPQINRTIRGDTREFELEGGHLTPGVLANWVAHPDPAAHYELTWKDDDHYELKVALTMTTLPKTCRLTIRRSGFSPGRTQEFPLEESSPLSLTGTAPTMVLRVDTRVPGAGEKGTAKDAEHTPKKRPKREGPGMDPNGLDLSPTPAAAASASAPRDEP